MIAMIDRTLLYKRRYEDLIYQNNTVEAAEYIKYKDADKYEGWREISVWFSGLFEILNSTLNRLNIDSYSHNLIFLEKFLVWFLNWKEECIAYRSLSLPSNPTFYQSMTGFFTYEASEDCITMVSGIIQLTEFYCARRNDMSKPFFLLPRRISQDLQENHFSKVRLALQHGRMDHRETFAACAKVNLMKEIKVQGRTMKKRNAGGSMIENADAHNTDIVEICSEYTTNLRVKIMSIKHKEFREIEPYYWKNVNGHDCLVFYDV